MGTSVPVANVWRQQRKRAKRYVDLASQGIKTFQPPPPATAVKRYFISTPPLILTLHLKRFEQVGARSGMKKFNGHVQFDMLLDLAPFCSDKVKVCYTNYKSKKN
jgi:hypothetical protein